MNGNTKTHENGLRDGRIASIESAMAVQYVTPDEPKAAWPAGLPKA